MVSFDPSINMGHVITIVTVLVSGYGVVVSQRKDSEARDQLLALRMDAVEKSMGKITDLLVLHGRMEERQNALDARLNAQSAEITDLRHGKGFIVKAGSSGIRG